MTSKPWIVPKLTPAERRTQRERRKDFWEREYAHARKRRRFLDAAVILFALAIGGLLVLLLANVRMP